MELGRGQLIAVWPIFSCSCPSRFGRAYLSWAWVWVRVFEGSPAKGVTDRGLRLDSLAEGVLGWPVFLWVPGWTGEYYPISMYWRAIS